MIEVHFDTDCGGGTFHLTEAEYADYHIDPVGFVAARLGFPSPELYLEWVDTGGTLRCNGKSATGHRCKKGSKIQLGVSEYVAKRDTFLCNWHNKH